MKKRLLAIALAAVGVAAMAIAPVAGADTGDIIEAQHRPPTAADGWQAGTCREAACTPESPEALFYTQAAGHPVAGITQFIVKHSPAEVGGIPLPGTEEPVGVVKMLRVDLPPGLSVNPEATPRCAEAEFVADPANCPAESIVGVSEITVAVAGVPATLPPIQVYNLVPRQGEPALFAFNAAGSNVFLTTDVAWESDYHEGFTIEVPPSPLGRLLKNRLVFSGQKGTGGGVGSGAFLTNPSTCFDPAEPSFSRVYSTWLRAQSAAEAAGTAPSPGAFPAAYTPFEAPLPPGIMPTGCGEVPFEPSVAADPGTTQTDSPTGGAVSLKVPFESGKTAIEADGPLADSNVRSARVSLPLGMGLNPSAANGLIACADGQFPMHSRAPVSCPPQSRVGTASIETPPLPAGSLTGSVYLGEQRSRNPASGEEFRIFVDAPSPRFGVDVRLVGHIQADPQTARLTGVFDEPAQVAPFAGTLPHGLPQVPFTDFTLRFDGGRGVLTSPSVCGPHRTTTLIEPWSSQAATRQPSSTFQLTGAPGGGACAKSGAERPFAPGFAATVDSPRAARQSALRVQLSRFPGQQELKAADITLPPGLIGKLAGVAYCPPAAIAQAAAASGAAERSHPSCPPDSLIGSASIAAGSGPNPLLVDGMAYLAGPYRGAPISMVVITPALAGPFDLGSVVVRVALYVDPITAQVHAVSDPIPHVFGGALLDIRGIHLNVDRREFVRVGTSCRPLATTGFLNGGGANPAAPAAFTAAPVSFRYRLTGCRALKFRPRLGIRLLVGRRGTFRNQHPKLRAVLSAREGDANIARAAVTLPHALILDQAHIRTVCTRVQLAARSCPKAAIYGHAVARTPLLENRLKGPVYLVSSKHLLPDLVADLRGQVEIQLHGVIKSVGKSGRIRNVFYPVPDVPVSKFVLTMKGGKRGLLVNSRNLCAARSFARVNLKAQNSRRWRKRHLPLRVKPCNSRKGQAKRQAKK